MPNALQIPDPNADNPLAQVPSPGITPSPFTDDADAFYAPSPLERWLAEQRAKNNARGFEPLPGITSGAPPKPWGLDRTQSPQTRPPYGPGVIVEGEMAPMSQEQTFRQQNWPAVPIPNNAGAPMMGVPIPNNAPGFYANDPQAQTAYQLGRTSPMMQYLQRLGLARPGVDI